jgi:hypothetical protein
MEENGNHIIYLPSVVINIPLFFGKATSYVTDSVVGHSHAIT